MLLESTSRQIPRVALPNKGRLADGARELLADAGFDLRSRGERALAASLGGTFEAIFVRAQDIPEIVADGVADAGLTGWDLIAEGGRDVEVLADLEFGRCRLVVAATDESGIARITDLPSGARVATSFPVLSRQFFAEQCRSVEIVPISGAAEIAPHLGLADVIVDLVATGSTLRVNGLHEVTTVLESSCRIIGRAGASDERARPIADLVTALESVVRARGRRYMMANVPRSSLASVREILPGIDGPTVIDIMNSGEHVAVHAVVAERAVSATIGRLKSLGASGILVTRIERLVP